MDTDLDEEDSDAIEERKATSASDETLARLGLESSEDQHDANSPVDERVAEEPWKPKDALLGVLFMLTGGLILVLGLFWRVDGLGWLFTAAGWVLGAALLLMGVNSIVQGLMGSDDEAS